MVCMPCVSFAAKQNDAQAAVTEVCWTGIGECKTLIGLPGESFSHAIVHCQVNRYPIVNEW